MERSPRNKSQKVFADWRKWNDEYILYLNNKCSDLMKIFGYGEEPEWKERLKQANKN